jgi:hypothetical protein
MLLQPGDGGGQSLSTLQGFEQCGPFALNAKQSIVVQSAFFVHGDMNGKSPLSPSSPASDDESGAASTAASIAAWQLHSP